MRSDDGRLAVIYSPLEEAITLRLAGMAAPIGATWFNPSTGSRQPAEQPAEQPDVLAQRRIFVLRFSAAGLGNWIGKRGFL